MAPGSSAVNFSVLIASLNSASGNLSFCQSTVTAAACQTSLASTPALCQGGGAAVSTHNASWQLQQSSSASLASWQVPCNNAGELLTSGSNALVADGKIWRDTQCIGDLVTSAITAAAFTATCPGSTNTTRTVSSTFFVQDSNGSVTGVDVACVYSAPPPSSNVSHCALLEWCAPPSPNAFSGCTATPAVASRIATNCSTSAEPCTATNACSTTVECGSDRVLNTIRVCAPTAGQSTTVVRQVQSGAFESTLARRQACPSGSNCAGVPRWVGHCQEDVGGTSTVCFGGCMNAAGFVAGCTVPSAAKSGYATFQTECVNEAAWSVNSFVYNGTDRDMSVATVPCGRRTMRASVVATVSADCRGAADLALCCAAAYEQARCVEDVPLSHSCACPGVTTFTCPDISCSSSKSKKGLLGLLALLALIPLVICCLALIYVCWRRKQKAGGYTERDVHTYDPPQGDDGIPPPPPVYSDCPPPPPLDDYQHPHHDTPMYGTQLGQAPPHGGYPDGDMGVESAYPAA
eukprot:TRINITY_DN44016_c0_g1_i1.p1 TRINITY_DN44016_c0_g1~~TRINITY_DN44016_c0_g1_i1.p1  ORF type:complete len:596 (+),score=50.49 TRINITY_DN44016_c0_g1_i1:232-1788(+)